MIIIFHEFLNFKIKLLILNLYLLRPLVCWMFIQKKYHYKGNISSWLCLSVNASVRSYVCRCSDLIITLICAIPCSKCFIKSCIKSNQPSLFYIEKLKEKNNLPKVRQLVSGRIRIQTQAVCSLIWETVDQKMSMVLSSTMLLCFCFSLEHTLLSSSECTYKST